MKNEIKMELQKIYSVKKYCSKENMKVVYQACSKYLSGLEDNEIDMLYMNVKTEADFTKFLEGTTLSSGFISSLVKGLNLYYKPRDYYLFNIIEEEKRKRDLRKI